MTLNYKNVSIRLWLSLVGLLISAYLEIGYLVVLFGFCAVVALFLRSQLNKAS